MELDNNYFSFQDIESIKNERIRVNVDEGASKCGEGAKIII